VDFEGFLHARMPQDVTVFFDDFHGISKSASADAAVWFEYLITTQATTTTILDGTDGAEDEAGGVVKLACDGTAEEGLNLQVNGEAFHLADGYPLYFEARVNAASILDCSWFVGLSCADATMEVCTDDTVDNIGFMSSTGVMAFVATKDSGTTKSVGCDITEGADDWIRVAFFWDGVDKVHYSVDINDKGEFEYKGYLDADTAAHMVAQDAMMTPVIECVAVATGSTHLYCDYILVMQQRFSE